MNYNALIRTVCYAAVLALLVFYYSPVVAQTPAEPAGPSVDFNTYFTTLSSPRDTLQAFLATTDRVYDLIRDDGINPENWPEIQRIVAQQMRMFDLRNVPPNYRSGHHDRDCRLPAGSARTGDPAASCRSTG